MVYSAAWGGQPYALFMTRPGSVESRALDVSDARLLAISSVDDLAFLRGTHEALTAFYAMPGTLARVSLNGGGPREILEDVMPADWLPGSRELAVIRGDRSSGRSEKKIYSSPRLPLTYLRIAPRGDRLALFEGGSLIVLDRSGRKQTLASGLIEAGSLVWSAAGDEIWFSGVRRYAEPALRAVSMSGVERVLLHAPPLEPLIIHDLLGDGRALIVRHHRQKGLSCLAPGETQPRELGWLDFTMPEALSADGRTVVFGEVLTGSGSAQVAYLRRTDGSDAVRLGMAFLKTSRRMESPSSWRSGARGHRAG